MADAAAATAATSSDADPLLLHLWSIKEALDSSSKDLEELLWECIEKFKDDLRYKNDARFLKIWFLYMDGSSNYQNLFAELMKRRICVDNSMLYESYALFMEAKGRITEAFFVYHMGISRNAEPLGRLKKAQVLFLERVLDIVTSASLPKIEYIDGVFVNPWLVSIIKNLLQDLKPQMLKYEGYQDFNKQYKGKVPLSTLQKSARNKTVVIGSYKYQIKGCAGQGGFAQVFKACVDDNADDVVALKIQKPSFPWEFYIYRQLDARIPEKERIKFGYAHRMHLYSDYSILVTDYLPHGTLQDAINCNFVNGSSMEEVLCMYYTIEMIFTLETLHAAAIIHGDFKPDNLLIRNTRNDLTEDGFREHTGPWRDQGLCLVDWGRGIDMRLFADDTKFVGDCRTSGFRCIEMQENKPWTYQVDTYGLCVNVYTMLHGEYMEIEKTASNGGYIYLPKKPYKRYWHAELWENLFTKLLNTNANEDHLSLLRSLRESFQDCLCANPQLIKKLKESLVKQKNSLCA